MNQISASHYSIPKEPGTGFALLLAGVMHVLLFLFLWFGIHWQSKTPVGVEAEIWDMTARQAAPISRPIVQPITEPSVENKPLPAPPEKVAPARPTAEQIEAEHEVEIALERARDKKAAEKKRLETQLAEQKLALEKAQQRQDALVKDMQHQKDLLKEQKLQKEQELSKLAEQKKQELSKAAEQKKQELSKIAEQKKLDQAKADQKKSDALAQKQRDDNLKRLTGQVVGSGGSGDAVKSTGNNRVDGGYAGRIAAKIKSNMVYVGADNGTDNPTVEFSVDLFPDGSLRGVPHKTRSSGVSAFDDAVERAISRSAPFPADKSGNVPSTIPLTYRLKD